MFGGAVTVAAALAAHCCFARVHVSDIYSSTLIRQLAQLVEDRIDTTSGSVYLMVPGSSFDFDSYTLLATHAIGAVIREKEILPTPRYRAVKPDEARALLEKHRASRTELSFVVPDYLLRPPNGIDLSPMMQELLPGADQAVMQSSDAGGPLRVWHWKG
jgi:hypothetical protein